ncbi:DNA mismatch repair protein, MutS family [Methanothrix harundinacea]|uniref:DNA-binding protein MutS2 n=1 Tax=Methanothrix harundinacea (strain 6Ac) TaxID=1110509 RepID=G7WMM3_METH6|nr:DNA mismatch repair protein, MutS family [Methanothrix harundinacea]AET63807.1 DNA mismatch repair protein, MutS family [Methanothrix harundinacea 6Ac]
MKLLDVPGVGSKLSERLITRYGDEEAALEALLRGDVAGLIEMRGMSERQATALVQRARGASYGVSPAAFLATEEAARIYSSLMELLVEEAHTDRARQRLLTLFPSSSREMIEENRRLAEEAVATAKRLQNTGIADHLSRLRPLRRGAGPRVRSRSVATDSATTFRALKDRGIDRTVDLHLVESSRDLRDLAQGYDLVTLLGRSIDSLSLPEVEEAVGEEEWYLVPERVLHHYQENETTIDALLKAAEILEVAEVARFEGLEGLSLSMAKLAEEGDPEVQRLERLMAEVEGRAEEAVAWANRELKTRMESCSVTLAGDDLLLALGKGGDLRDVFRSRMGETFAAVLRSARERASSGLHLKGSEGARLEELISPEVRYPLEVDRAALAVFVQEMRKRAEARRLKARREVAKELSGMWELVVALHERLLDFDFIYSLGSFALSRGLAMPAFVEEPCIGFLEGRSLFLKDPEPVSYSVGHTGLAGGGETTAILSGVNSGGKTALLELVAQVAVLAHMGLPVPARSCRLSLFESLYHFGKSRGTLGAGAFEATIRKFSALAGEGRKLVLADELEAMTEPGASARIIASLLGELSRGGSVAIFVSHLAEEVARFAETAVRIDGIEARGLDEEYRLIVDRSPRYRHLAKSTPELILERLARTAEGGESEFYGRLLSKFR